MEAGETFATATFAGSTKSMSRRALTDRIISSRTRASADGLEKRISSFVNTDNACTLAHVSAVLNDVALLSGVAKPSPTQLPVSPAEKPDTRTLNGTRFSAG